MHACNKHSGFTETPTYTACNFRQTGPRPTKKKQKHFFIAGEHEEKMLKKVFTDNTVLWQEFQYLSAGGSTSRLESYHALLNLFCPNRVYFTSEAMDRRCVYKILKNK